MYQSTPQGPLQHYSWSDFDSDARATRRHLRSHYPAPATLSAEQADYLADAADVFADVAQDQAARAAAATSAREALTAGRQASTAAARAATIAVAMKGRWPDPHPADRARKAAGRAVAAFHAAEMHCDRWRRA